MAAARVVLSRLALSGSDWITRDLRRDSGSGRDVVLVRGLSLDDDAVALGQAMAGEESAYAATAAGDHLVPCDVCLHRFGVPFKVQYEQHSLSIAGVG